MDQQLATIHEKTSVLLDQLRNGDVFESLPDLLRAIREDIDLQPAQVTRQPDDGHQELDQMTVYQEHWSDPDDDQMQIINDFDLRQFVNLLASTNPKFRDTGAFFFLGNAVQSHHLNQQQLDWLTAELISEERLLTQILEEKNDGAYQRSYSLALLSIVLMVDQQLATPFISTDLRKAMVDYLGLYTLLESDSRGFIPGHGWIHSYAHLANVLSAMFERSDVPRSDKLFLLACLMANLRSLNTPLTMGEMPRLVRAILKLVKKHNVYEDYFLLSLKLWRQDIVNEPFAQTRSRWQKLYNRVDFFQQILAFGPDEVPTKIWNYAQAIKNNLS